MALNDSDMAQLVAMLNQIDIRFKVRRKTAASWTASNEVLLSGEWGKETDTGKMKQGDGTTAWNSLPYFASGASVNVQTVTSASTVTPNASDDLVVISALAVPATIADPAGPESDGQGFVLRIKDNGTSRALTWGAAYRAVGGALPASTTASQWAYLPVSYNATDDKWDVFFDQVGDPDAHQVQTFTSTATITPAHNDDMVVVSAQAANLTIANPTGAASWGDGFVLAIKDSGTSRTLTWGADYRGMGAALVAATTINKWMYFPVTRNQADGYWDVFPPTVQQ